jgi:hypothetical protein
LCLRALSADRSANERLPGVGYGIVLDAGFDLKTCRELLRRGERI